jgi:hypothetical protein
MFILRNKKTTTTCTATQTCQSVRCHNVKGLASPISKFFREYGRKFRKKKASKFRAEQYWTGGPKLGLWFTHILNVKWPPRRACLGGAVVETRLEFREKLATTRARLGGALIETMKWFMVGIMAPPRQARAVAPVISFESGRDHRSTETSSGGGGFEPAASEVVYKRQVYNLSGQDELLSYIALQNKLAVYWILAPGFRQYNAGPRTDSKPPHARKIECHGRYSEHANSLLWYPRKWLHVPIAAGT